MKSALLFVVMAILLNANSAFASGSLWSCGGEKVQMSGISGYKSFRLYSGELTVEGKSYQLGVEQRNRGSNFQEFQVEGLDILIIPITFFLHHEATAELIIRREGELFPVETVVCKIVG